jgi:ankyrin repeat protein
MNLALESVVPEIVSFFITAKPSSREALIQAVKLGDHEIVDRFLRLSGSADYVNVVTAEGTPLGIAAANGDVRMINLLLSVPGINGMLPDLQGNSPFVNACQCTNDSTVWRMLSDFCGEELSGDYYQLNAGFFYASQRPRVDVAFELWPFFSQFALLDPNFHLHSSSAFIRSVELDTSELLRLFLEFPGINVNDQAQFGWTALIAAVELGSLEHVRLLVADPRVDLNIVDFRGDSALSTAAPRSDPDIVALLLACDRLDLRTSGGCAIADAIMRDLPNTVQLLLARPDIDVSERGLFSSRSSSGGYPRTALWAAICRRHLGWINQIVTHPRFDPVRSGLPSLLFAAIEIDAFPTFTALLGNNLTVRGPIGESLLVAAIRAGRLEFMEHIRDHPAFDLAQQMPQQLLWAAATPALSIALPFLLTLPGIDLNAPLPQHLGLLTRNIARPASADRYDANSQVRTLPRRGNPMVFSMVSTGLVSWGRMLSSPHFDVNQRGSHGQTILFEWTSCGHFVGWLVRHGKLDISLTDRHGNSALICALIARSEIIKAYLELPFESAVRNENGDAAWALINDRVKRTRIN